MHLFYFNWSKQTHHCIRIGLPNEQAIEHRHWNKRSNWMHIKKERSQNRRIKKGTKTNLRIRKKTSRRHLRRTIRPKKKESQNFEQNRTRRYFSECTQKNISKKPSSKGINTSSGLNLHPRNRKNWSNKSPRTTQPSTTLKTNYHCRYVRPIYLSRSNNLRSTPRLTNPEEEKNSQISRSHTTTPIQNTGKRKREAAHPPDHERVGGALHGEVHHAGDPSSSSPEQPPPTVPRPVPLPQVLHRHPLVRQRALQPQRRRQRRRARPSRQHQRGEDRHRRHRRELRRPPHPARRLAVADAARRRGGAEAAPLRVCA